MQSIDFLPQTYHRGLRKRRLRKQKLWLTAGMIALVVVWAGGELLLLEKKSLTVQKLQQRVEIEASAVQQRRILAARQTRLAARMRLHDSLKLPISYALVHQAIAQSMPSSVGLVRLEIVHEGPEPETLAKVSKGSGNAPKPQRAARAPKAAPKPLAASDRRIMVYLQGVGPNDQDIQRMVAGLQETPLFSEVHFRSSRDESVRELEARGFNLVLRIDLNRAFVGTPGKEVANAG